MIKEAIIKVVARQDLSEQEAQLVMDEIMDGLASPAQIGSFLTALRLKGETVDEVTGFARSMRSKAIRIQAPQPMVVDTCGTGGDGADTFNISTTAAFVVAGAGLPVAKHGNRSVSSNCGSADVLEALGVNVNLPAEVLPLCFKEVGMAFLFAPALHGAMKHAAAPRREIGIRTVFNILGPLTNPAGAQAQVLGVYAPEITELMAEVLGRLGIKQAFVVHGAGGLDEISLAGPSRVSKIAGGSVTTFYLDPADYGFLCTGIEALRGGDAGVNAAITRGVLEGKRGPQRDVTVINAALALVAGEKAEDIDEGIALAERSIDSGAAMAKLDQLINFSRRYLI